MNRTRAALLAALIVLSLAPARAQAEIAPADIRRQELIMVRVQDGALTGPAEILGALDRAQPVPELDLPQVGVRVFWTPGRDAVVPPAVTRLPGVSWASKVAVWRVEPLTGKPAFEPTMAQAGEDADREPFWVLQWNLRRGTIGGEPTGFNDVRDAWTMADGEGALVGIVDTGVDCSHVDIPCTRRLDHYDALRRVELDQATDRLGHGTHVAGIAAARLNRRGVVGVAPRAEVVSAKACSDGGTCSELDVMAALIWLIERQEVPVVNASLGGGFGGNTSAMCEVTGWATLNEVLVVASVGNAGSSQPLYPASCDTVLGVAASIPPDGDRVAEYSQRRSVDITAPGGDGGDRGVVSAIPGDGWAYMSGTSMASPHVAGAGALLFDALGGYQRDGGRWSVGLATQLLLDNARRICGTERNTRLCGDGALDVVRAVRSVRPNPPDQEPTNTADPVDTVEPTPTLAPTSTHVPAVQTAIAELTGTATATETPVPATQPPPPTGTPGPADTATATAAPPASATFTPRPTGTATPGEVDLTVTALWPTATIGPTATIDVAGTLTAIAPTPWRVATDVWGTVGVPTQTEAAARTSTAEATAAAGRAEARHGPYYFPALLRVLEPTPTPSSTDNGAPRVPCQADPWPEACREATIQAERRETAEAWDATATANAAVRETIEASWTQTVEATLVRPWPMRLPMLRPTR